MSRSTSAGLRGFGKETPGCRWRSRRPASYYTMDDDPDSQGIRHRFRRQRTERNLDGHQRRKERKLKVFIGRVQASLIAF